MRWGNSTLCIGDWLCISRSLSRQPQICGTEEGISPTETRPSSGSGEQTVLSSQTTVSSQQELRTGTLDTEDLSPLLSRARLDLLEVPDHSEMLSVGTRLAGFSQQRKDILGDCWAAWVLRSLVLLEWDSMPPSDKHTGSVPHSEWERGVTGGRNLAAGEGGHRASPEIPFPGLLQQFSTLSVSTDFYLNSIESGPFDVRQCHCCVIHQIGKRDQVFPSDLSH